MKIRPIHEQIIVKRKTEREEKTAGGLFIPGTATEKPLEGEVLAVGTGRVLPSGTVVPPAVKAGDKILFNKHSFVEVKVEGEEYLIMREDAILAVLNDG